MIKISVLTPSIRPEGLKIVQECLARQTFKEFEWLTEIGIPGNGHSLNADYNRMLRRAKGELMVSYQDFLKIPDDGLERFWKAYQENPRTFYTAPMGKVDSYDQELARWDWRNYNVFKMKSSNWEIDWGSAPISALKEIGGFDEELDKYWSCDNVNVAFRAELAGYTFDNLIDNKAIALDHDKTQEHPFRKNFKPEFNDMRMKLFAEGLKIDYLS